MKKMIVTVVLAMLVFSTAAIARRANSNGFTNSGVGIHGVYAGKNGETLLKFAQAVVQGNIQSLSQCLLLFIHDETLEREAFSRVFAVPLGGSFGTGPVNALELAAMNDQDEVIAHLINHVDLVDDEDAIRNLTSLSVDPLLPTAIHISEHFNCNKALAKLREAARKSARWRHALIPTLPPLLPSPVLIVLRLIETPIISMQRL